MNGLLRAGLPALALAGAGLAAAQGADIRRQTVSLTEGPPAAMIEGRVQGDRTVDDRIRAGAGQTLALSLRSANASLNLNLLPPGSADAAMFIGHLQGREAQPMLPADGQYVVRVYLVRSAARRQESAA